MQSEKPKNEVLMETYIWMWVIYFRNRAEHGVFMLHFLLRSLMEIYSNMQNAHEHENNVLILNYDGFAAGSLYGVAPETWSSCLRQGPNTHASYHTAFTHQYLRVTQEARGNGLVSGSFLRSP